MKCTRIGKKSCNCSCFEIDQEMDAILLIIESSLNQYNNAAKYIWYEMVSGYGYEIAILWYEMAMVRNGYGTK